MACFRPRLLYPPASGSGKWSCDPVNGARGAEGLPTACGRCRGCLLRRCGEWTQRCLWELDNPEHDGEACFLTLTFRDEDLPADYSVSVEDISAFVRALRQAVVRRMKAGLLPAKEDAKGRLTAGIRFYAVGEYGEKEDATKRPHYHIIVFGWSPHDLEAVENSQRGLPQWRSPFLGGVERDAWKPEDLAKASEDDLRKAERSGIWKKGRVRVGKVTRQSINYVTGYVFDMRFGDQAKEEYGARVHAVTGEVCSVRAPFNHMSRMPGIGHWWFAEFADTDALAEFVIRDERKVDEALTLQVIAGMPVAPRASAHRTTRVLMPRYVVRQLLKPMSEEQEVAFKAQRRAKAAAAALQRASDNTPARLLTREAVKLLGASSLSRSGGDAVELKAMVDAMYDEAGRLAEAERNGSAQAERDEAARLVEVRRRARLFS